MTFSQQFYIHPVGQGFFYTGKVVVPRTHPFFLVFDCGSFNRKAILREIEIFKDQNLNLREIDLLVISHFDADHVNHIKDLISGGIKIRRLVMPMLLFEERLSLVLRRIGTIRKRTDEDEFFIRMALDPINTLGDSLDRDSEIYFIEGDDDPISPDNDSNFGDGRPVDDDRMHFDIWERTIADENLAKELKLNFNQKKVFRAKDSRKGLCTCRRGKIMDFLFYKNKIHPNDDLFFEEVTKAFLIKHDLKINEINSSKEIIKIIIKEYLNSKAVKGIFEIAAKNARVPKSAIINLNFSALCLMHRNVSDLIEVLSMICNHKLPKHEYFESEWAWNFNKHPATVTAAFPVHCYKPIDSKAPNTMLTSDAPLDKADNLAAFRFKYGNYLADCHFLQIPHHGSKYNSTWELPCQFPSYIECFINYGTNNTWGHPDSRIFWPYSSNNMYILINELQGRINKYKIDLQELLL